MPGNQTFACVEMKHRIQEKLLAEYEARKGVFSSFEEFVKAEADASPWVRKMRTRIAAAKNKGAARRHD